MNEEPTSYQQLANVLSSMVELPGEVDFKKLKYVIYARKSTDDPERQQRSLPDQIKECRNVARDLGLNVVGEPIEESESARTSGIRPKFRAMLNDIAKGKYDGIISWHPDRLSRNMKEGGEIIDLLDHYIIKDMRFATFHFENNPSGKMLLGITFVLSKHYTDHLSENVLRGNKNSVSDARYVGNFVHGYYKDANQKLRPDGKNFQLIKEAWNKRLNRETLSKIALFLKEERYEVAIGVGGLEHRVYDKFSDKILSIQVFEKPMYAGVLKYGKNILNLMEEDPEFVPMITPEQYYAINKKDLLGKTFRQRSRGIRGSVKANFLREVVFCASCGQPRHSGLTPKKTKDGKKHYYLYRCETPGCPEINKSVRAKIIINFASDFLRKHQFGPELYTSYIEGFKKRASEKTEELLKQKMSLTKSCGELRIRIDEITKYIPKAPEGTRKTFEKELVEKQAEYESAKEKLAGVIQKIKNGGETPLAYEKFLELVKNLPDSISENQKMSRLDFILRQIFSNFTVTGSGTRGKVTYFELKKPFSDLYSPTWSG